VTVIAATGMRFNSVYVLQSLPEGDLRSGKDLCEFTGRGRQGLEVTLPVTDHLWIARELHVQHKRTAGAGNLSGTGCFRPAAHPVTLRPFPRSAIPC
jgi:hypothetical protein